MRRFIVSDVSHKRSVCDDEKTSEGQDTTRRKEMFEEVLENIEKQ